MELWSVMLIIALLTIIVNILVCYFLFTKFLKANEERKVEDLLPQLKRYLNWLSASIAIELVLAIVVFIVRCLSLLGK